MKSEYREIAPCRCLSRYVDCFWIATRDAHAPPVTRRVLPDGCFDLLFDALRPGHQQGVAVGTMSKALELKSVTACQSVAVRFRPGGAAPFLGIPLNEFTDQVVAFSDMECFKVLRQQLVAASTVSDQLECLQRWLLQRQRHVSPPVPRLIESVSRMNDPSLRTSKLAAQLGVSRQYLARIFRDQVGVSPKTMMRIMRLQRWLKLRDQADCQGPSHPSSPANDAIAAGYFDQSHLGRECRLLTGLSPRQLWREHKWPW